MKASSLIKALTSILASRAAYEPHKSTRADTLEARYTTPECKAMTSQEFTHKIIGIWDSTFERVPPFHTIDINTIRGEEWLRDYSYELSIRNVRHGFQKLLRTMISHDEIHAQSDKNMFSEAEQESDFSNVAKILTKLYTFDAQLKEKIPNAIIVWGHSIWNIAIDNTDEAQALHAIQKVKELNPRRTALSLVKMSRNSRLIYLRKCSIALQTFFELYRHLKRHTNPIIQESQKELIRMIVQTYRDTIKIGQQVTRMMAKFERLELQREIASLNWLSDLREKYIKLAKVAWHCFSRQLTPGHGSKRSENSW